MKSLFSALALILALGLSAQSYNMPYQGTDTLTDCSGTLYDHGGPSNSYSNGANGLVFIIPNGNPNPGIPLTITFQSFNLECCCDFVRIYDGIGTSNQIGSYNCSALPNGGTAITLPSGVATVRFFSDGSVTRAGFQLSWNGGSGGNVTAQFTANNSNPPLGAPISFSNNSVNGGNSFWDFGDGNTSSNANPTHAYQSPGTYQVRLIESNCQNTDTSAFQTITVQNAPSYSFSPATFADTVPCGGVYRDTLDLNLTGGGDLFYQAGLRSLVTETLWNEGFETGMGSFVQDPQASSNFSAQAVLGGAAVGQGSLQMNGGNSLDRGLESRLPSPRQPNYLSVYVRRGNTFSHNAELRLGLDQGNFMSPILEIELIGTGLRVRGSNNSTTLTAVVSQWYHVEIFDIDFANQTFRVRIDGVDDPNTFSFLNPVSGVDMVDINNYNFNVLPGFDELLVQMSDTESGFNLPQDSAVISAGGTGQIPFSITLNQLTAGLRQYELQVQTNAAAPNDLLLLPIDLYISGTPGFAASAGCLAFDSVFTGFSGRDSVLIFNSGCDTLLYSGISSSNADFVPAQSQFQVAPFDSAWLAVNFNASAVGNFSDTLFLTGSGLDTTLCLQASVLATPAVAFDSARYLLNSYGCNDSIPFSFYLKNIGAANLQWQIQGGLSRTDDFENGFDGSLWSTLGSNSILFQPCYYRSGNYALSFDGTNRVAQTVPLDVNVGDSVSFWVRDGFSSSGSGCENPDGNETLSLQYRLLGSSFWTTLTTVPSVLSGPTRYAVVIPQSGRVEFRLFQSSYSGSGFDNYLVDDFSISTIAANTSFNPDSGTTSAGDSVLVFGYLDIAGQGSGSVQRRIQIVSNDPAQPDTSFIVDINIFGRPDLDILSAACLSFDSTFAGGSSRDSILIANAGCDSLSLSGYQFVGSHFAVDTLPLSLAPGDSLWLPLLFQPSAGTLGLLNDTLSLLNNDTTQRFCLSGVALGAPLASLSPDSLSVTVTNCGDSLNLPLVLRNTGQGPLDYQVNRSQGGNQQIEVLLYAANRSFTEYSNVFNFLQANADFNLTETFNTSLSAITTDLQGKDVIIFPENFSSNSVLDDYQSLLQQFTNNGGLVIMLGSSWDRIDALGLMDVINIGLAPPFVVNVPGHPVMQGTAASLPSLSATRVLRFNDLTNVTLLAGGNAFGDAVVAAKRHNSGASVYIGFDYFATSNDLELMLENSVRWSRSLSLPNFIRLSPDSGRVATNDSVNLNVGISTRGLRNGVYNFLIPIATNDPTQPLLEVPLNLTVNGSERIEGLTANCLHFDSIQQGATAVDTALVTNIGCDSLFITGFSGGQGVFSLNNLPLSLAPGDTVGLAVSFNPLTVGSFNDTLLIANSDTTLALCLTGTSVGAPFVALDPDTIYHRLNKCKIIGNEQFSVRNPGQGALSFNASIGRYQAGSKIFYNQSGATTNHLFNNLPSDADSLLVQIIINGDYEWWNEDCDVYVDNWYIGEVGNGSQFYQADTFNLFLTGTALNTRLSDGSLNIQMLNTSSVDGGVGSFHEVNITLVQSINWVSLQGASSGTVPAGGSVNRNLIFNAALLPLGRHITFLNLSNNSPGNPQFTRPIVVDVVSEPEVVLSDTCLVFPLTPLGDTTTRSFTVYNQGCQNLNVSSILSGGPSFRVSPANGNIPVDDSLVVTVRFIPTAVSNFSSSIFLSNNDTNRTVCLTAVSGAMPVADFSFSVENLCIGQVRFVNNSQFFNNVVWDFGDGNLSTQASPLHTFPGPGTYRVSLRASNALGNDTISKLVFVNPLQVAFSASKDTAQLNDTVYFADSSNLGQSWLWDFGDGNTSTQQNPSHAYTSQGLFTVRLTVTDARACSRSATRQVRVENKIGLYESQQSHYSLYPNPSPGVVHLLYTGEPTADRRVSLWNGQGQCLLRQNWPGDSNKAQFDLENWPAGVYFLRLEDRKGNFMGQWQVIRR